MSNLTPKESEFILYTTPNGDVRLDVLVLNETIWLTQKSMSELFGVVKSTISEHLNNVYENKELTKNSTVRKFRTVRHEGGREVTRNIEFYNLDAIISVGYRVNSTKATQFRIWATKTLTQYIVKGYALDDNRLKSGSKIFKTDYFEELLDRVRSIRSSERRIYQQITDIFSECCIDYDPDSMVTKNFYATIQNKFHFAITGSTAAELVHQHADSNKENMGLTTWKHAPKGRILKSDTSVAKNYLSIKEIKRLERTVSGYFDYVENLIENKKTFTMEYVSESVNKFLSFNEYKILEGKGVVSRKDAMLKSSKEYDKFNKTQYIDSDFDKQISQIKFE
jgi:hypothetical protein